MIHLMIIDKIAWILIQTVVRQAVSTIRYALAKGYGNDGDCNLLVLHEIKILTPVEITHRMEGEAW